MDKLRDTLKADAGQIRVTISDELDARIHASLQGVEPELPARQRQPRKSFSFWFASSLTGIAATILVIVVANLKGPGAPVTVASSPATNSATPVVTEQAFAPLLKAESAVLTAPLREELENLESDLKKAERAVREEIGLSF